MAFYCIFSAQYLPTIGGVENFSHNLAKRLTARGHNVTIITSAIDALPEKETDDFGVSIVRVPSFQLLNKRLPVVKPTARTATLIREALSKEGCRVVVNTRFYPLSLYAVRLASRLKRHTIVIEHGSAHLSLGNRLFDVAVNCYEHIVCAMVKHYCKNFYAISARSLDWLLHFSISANGVICNAIDTEEVDKIDIATFSRTQHNIASEQKIICYVGRMIPEKGVLPLVSVFNELFKSYPDYTLVMAGDGPLLSTLQQNAQNGIVFCGKLNRDSCVALFKQSEIFCLPTVSEGFSTTLLEAAAAGCFVVTTKGCGGAKEVFGNSTDGIITTGNTADEIKTALIAAIEDGDRAQKTKRVRARIKDTLSWEHCCDAIEKITG